MARTVAIGVQDFETVRKNNLFYIDKTDFIKQWWEQGDSVTLITRPRRFGKTLAMRMVEDFISVKYAGRLIREGSKEVKQQFELLLQGGCLKVRMDEQIVYGQLLEEESSIWSLFLPADI